MRNSEASIRNSVNEITHADKFHKILLQIWSFQITKYFLSLIIISTVGLLLYFLKTQISYQAVSLVFLFVISLLPLINLRPGPIFLAAFYSAFIWNYFFIPPAFTLRIGKIEDVLMYAMYFMIAIVSGLLISRIRLQQMTLNQKERRTTALYNLTRNLSASKSLDDVTECSVRQLKETFHAEVVFIYSESENKLSRKVNHFSSLKIDDGEWNIAQMVYSSQEKIGVLIDEIPSITRITYLPIYSKEKKLGIIGLIFPENLIVDKETTSLLNTFINQISIAVEREYLKELAKQNLIIVESEKLYKTLFDSISHELKTPITTILGAVSSLKDEKIINNQSAFYHLINEANIAAERLKRLVENLLDITRLESGALQLKKQWHSFSDLINSVVNRIRMENLDHKIKVQMDENTGLGNFDFPLVEQSLVNIVHNSIEYTSPDCTVEINAQRQSEKIIITISDDGLGFPEDELKNIFKKFYRIPGTKAGGTGLGLSIAKGFIEAHGGNISAQNRKIGGAEFIVSLPIN